MAEARDTVLISFPFAAGVLLAAHLPPSFPSFDIALPAVAILMLLAAAGRLDRRFSYVLLFFVIGMLGGLTGGSFADSFGTGAGRAISGRALEFTDSLIKGIPFEHSGTNDLLRALLTGQRDGLDRETVAAFRAAGASHILALSGLHLGIIYLLISKLLLILGNGRIMGVVRSILIFAACAFYSLVTGASPSIVRALLFIGINEFMRHFPGRRKSPLAVWCCALMVQLLVSPSVITSVGFQLSYLAMLGIFVIYPPLYAWYPAEGRRKGPVRWIWASMALSISCQIFTAPLVWKVFGTFPKYFLLTNLLALPLTSMLMFSAVACLALSALGICPGWLVWAVDTFAYALQGCLSIIAELA